MCRVHSRHKRVPAQYRLFHLPVLVSVSQPSRILPQAHQGKTYLLRVRALRRLSSPRLVRVQLLDRLVSGSYLRQISAILYQANNGNLSVNVPASPPRATTPNSAFGAGLAQQLNIPTEAPPAYSSSTTAFIGSNASLFNNAQLDAWQLEYDRNLKGSMYLKPVTAAGSIDIICCMFMGKTYIESILMDISPVVALPPSWSTILPKLQNTQDNTNT